MIVSENVLIYLYRMNKFEKIREKISKIMENSKFEEDPGHSISVWKWVLKLKPDASEELQIAALAHDIDRAVEPTIMRLKGQSYYKYKAIHAKRSAEIIEHLMREFGYTGELVKRVKFLVENHEVGGDPETDVLRDADSISYFDYNINFYFSRFGPETTKKKIRFMYRRASDRVKEYIFSLRQSSDIQKQIDSAIAIVSSKTQNSV